MFVGVRATNIDACAVQMTGALRDETSLAVQLDSRTVNLTRGADGWGTSAIPGLIPDARYSNYLNIPACPAGWTTTSVFDHELRLEITLTDRRGNMLTKSVRVTPRCIDNNSTIPCTCVCRAGSVLGDACPTDGGNG